MPDLKSQQELLTEFIQEVQSKDPSLTDDIEGSKIDIIGGAATTAVSEVTKTVVAEFKKTFIDTSDGPEITGGVDDLERLLVDHWGEEFERPEPTEAIGEVTFERPNAGAGNCIIAIGTIINTRQNAAGESQRFEVTSQVTMVGTEITAPVKALVAGPAGNVNPDTVVEIETSLTDPTITVTNEEAFVGGRNTLTDAEYRQYARTLLRSIGGGSIEALEAAAKTVPGVVFATGFEYVKYVREWNIATDEPIGPYFRIVQPILYIADTNGNASQPLIDAVKAAIEEVRANGVLIDVQGLVVVVVNWTAQMTLNSLGPNFTELSQNPQRILDTMTSHLQSLVAGQDFVRATGEAYVMSIWGPSGTNDLTAFTTTIPSGSIFIDDNEKGVPGTVGTV